MSAEADQVRRGVNALVVLTAGGLLAELSLLGHWGSPVQGAPFVITILAASVAMGHLFGARVPRSVCWTVSGMCLLGGAFGVFEHMEHNWEFAAEIDATAGARELAWEAITGGNPALAPGAVGLLGMLGWLGMPAR